MANNINPTSFRIFRDDFLLVVLEHGLDIYIEKSYEDVCLHVSQLNPSVNRNSIDLFVKTQSSSMTAVLMKALGVHAARHNDRMIAAANLPENNGLFIKNNIHWLWNDLLIVHETVSKFTKVRLLSSLFQHHHKENDDPSIILEKLMKVKRQLKSQNFTVVE